MSSRNHRPPHAAARADHRLRLPRLPQGADRFRTDPDATAAPRATPPARPIAGADLVIVNTCGFIDDAVQGKPGHHRRGAGRATAGSSSPAAWAPRHGEGGGNLVRQMHPKVLAVTGPHATQEVMDAVHQHTPKPHDPFIDLVPRAGHQADAAPLRLPEDQRRLQPPLHLLHHPRHARRPGVAADRRRARRGAAPVRSGREGAAGGQPGHQRLRRRRQVPHRLLGRQAGEDAHVRPVRAARPAGRRLRRLGAAALRVPVPACRSRSSR